ncbi:hypothetical protein V8E36_009350 [Tilletia maclaganii]
MAAIPYPSTLPNFNFSFRNIISSASSSSPTTASPSSPVSASAAAAASSPSSAHRRAATQLSTPSASHHHQAGYFALGPSSAAAAASPISSHRTSASTSIAGAAASSPLGRASSSGNPLTTNNNNSTGSNRPRPASYHPHLASHLNPAARRSRRAARGPEVASGGRRTGTRDIDDMSEDELRRYLARQQQQQQHDSHIMEDAAEDEEDDYEERLSQRRHRNAEGGQHTSFVRNSPATRSINSIRSSSSSELPAYFIDPSLPQYEYRARPVWPVSGPPGLAPSGAPAMVPLSPAPSYRQLSHPVGIALPAATTTSTTPSPVVTANRAFPLMGSSVPSTPERRILGLPNRNSPPVPPRSLPDTSGLSVMRGSSLLISESMPVAEAPSTPTLAPAAAGGGGGPVVTAAALDGVDHPPRAISGGLTALPLRRTSLLGITASPVQAVSLLPPAYQPAAGQPVAGTSVAASSATLTTATTVRSQPISETAVTTTTTSANGSPTGGQGVAVLVPAAGAPSVPTRSVSLPGAASMSRRGSEALPAVSSSQPATASLVAAGMAPPVRGDSDDTIMGSRHADPEEEEPEEIMIQAEVDDAAESSASHHYFSAGPGAGAGALGIMTPLSAPSSSAGGRHSPAALSFMTAEQPAALSSVAHTDVADDEEEEDETPMFLTPARRRSSISNLAHDQHASANADADGMQVLTAPPSEPVGLPMVKGGAGPVVVGQEEEMLRTPTIGGGPSVVVVSAPLGPERRRPLAQIANGGDRLVQPAASGAGAERALPPLPPMSTVGGSTSATSSDSASATAPSRGGAANGYAPNPDFSFAAAASSAPAVAVPAPVPSERRSSRAVGKHLRAATTTTAMPSSIISASTSAGGGAAVRGVGPSHSMTFPARVGSRPPAGAAAVAVPPSNNNRDAFDSSVESTSGHASTGAGAGLFGLSAREWALRLAWLGEQDGGGGGSSTSSSSSYAAGSAGGGSGGGGMERRSASISAL